MSELAILGDAPVSRYGTEDTNQDDFTKGKNFLPRIEFKSSASAIVKSKKFPCDHYALVKGKELYDMGETFTAIILSYRYKALDFSNVKSAKDGEKKVLVSYDPKSEVFQNIKAEADKPRPPGVMAGAMYGAEFLLAVKRPDGLVELATILCGSTSWKMAAKKMFALTRKFASFGSKLIEGRFTYMSPEVSAFGGTFSLEGIPGLNKEIQDFALATGTEESVVEDSAVEDRVR